MRIALINGPTADGSPFVREGRCTQRSSIWSTQWPPIGLATLAAVARADGHDPAIHDAPAEALPARGLVARLARERPALAGIAISTPSLADDMALAAAVRAALPETRVAVFGVHATAEAENVLAACPAIDAAIRGEPEETLRDLARAMDEGAGLAEVAGLSFRDGAAVRRNPDRPPIADLDALPYPAWDLIDTRRHRLPFRLRRFLSVAPLRGCPYHCTFCTAGAYYGHAVRLRSPESVAAEIARGAAAFGVRDFFFWAETFTLDRAFVLALCDAIRARAPRARWTCNSRLDTVDAGMLRAMRAAGCWMIGFGIESTDPRVLAEARKGGRVVDAAEAVRLARAAGIRALGHFILGLPGDTPASLARTIEDAARLDLDFAQFYAAAPFVGSELHAVARERGYLDGVEFAGIGQDRASLRLPGLPPAVVDRLRARAVRRFYLRPRHLARLARFAHAGLPLQAAREVARRIAARVRALAS